MHLKVEFHGTASPYLDYKKKSLFRARYAAQTIMRGYYVTVCRIVINDAGQRFSVDNDRVYK